MRAGTLLTAVVGVSVAAAGPPSDKAVLARVGAHVAAYARELPHIVGEETSQQREAPASGYSGESRRRQLVADLAWVRINGIPEAIGVREVRAIDGVPVGVPDGRLLGLIRSGRGRFDEARLILDEGAKHNLAPGSRNFNIPTFVFFLAHPEMQPRFSWRRRGPASSAVREFEFREKSRPTVIRDEDGAPIFMRGRIQVDVASGGIVGTGLELDLKKVDYTLTVTFAPDRALGLVLPTELREVYATKALRVDGSATYANYRRFTTGGRLLN